MTFDFGVDGTSIGFFVEQGKLAAEISEHHAALDTAGCEITRPRCFTPPRPPRLQTFGCGNIRITKAFVDYTAPSTMQQSAQRSGIAATPIRKSEALGGG
jgi:hypothetical protein